LGRAIDPFEGGAVESRSTFIESGNGVERSVSRLDQFWPYSREGLFSDLKFPKLILMAFFIFLQQNLALQFLESCPEGIDSLGPSYLSFALIALL